MAKKSDTNQERKNLPINLVTALLTEAGYRCAVPTCRTILALDMHHIWPVSADGPNELSNLIALCPTCHQLYHRGTIRPESIHSWKAMLIAIGRGFDVETIDKLMFLYKAKTDRLAVSGDGVLSFARLIAADLAAFQLKANNAWQLVTYTVELTEKGRKLVEAWQTGDRALLERVLAPPPPIDPAELTSSITT